MSKPEKILSLSAIDLVRGGWDFIPPELAARTSSAEWARLASMGYRRLPAIAGGATPSGRLGHWGFGKEVTFGSPVAVTRYAQFIQDQLFDKIEEIIPANIVGVWDEGPSFAGLYEHMGRLRSNVYADFPGLLFTSGIGADSLQTAAAAPTGTPSTSGGTLATGAYFVRVAPIFGPAAGIVTAAGTFVGVLGALGTESTSQSVTGPTGSIAVTIPAVSGAAGYAVFYTTVGGGAGNETLMIVTTTTSATITSTTVSGGVVSASPPANASRNVHIFNPRQADWGTNSVVQPLTFENFRDSGQAYQYTGVGVEKWRMMIGVGKGRGTDMVLTAEWDAVTKGVARISPTTTTFDSMNPFLWSGCAISLGGSPYKVMVDLQVECDNGIEGMAFLDGTNQIQQLVPRAGRILNVTGTALLDDTQFTNFFSSYTMQDLNVIFTGPAIAGTGGGTFQFGIDMPKFLYKAYDVGITSLGVITVKFVAKAKYDFGNATQPAPGSPYQVQLVNDVATAF